MLVRILKPCKGIVDGVSLGQLQVGLSYDETLSLGTWLVSQGCAEEDVRPGDALIIPADEGSNLSRGVTVVFVDDRPPRRRRIILRKPSHK
jgi:hypothetical protein